MDTNEGCCRLKVDNALFKAVEVLVNHRLR